MRVLVFEFMTGGGVADQHPIDDESETFLAQGHSMLTAVCEDLLSLGHEVVTLVDITRNISLPKGVTRIGIESESEVDPSLFGAAMASDDVLLIAPESDGCLERLAALLSSIADRFISPNLNFIRLTGNKWDCYNWLLSRKVPCPESVLMTSESDAASLPNDFLPCVVKPVFGAGSEGLRLIESANELKAFDSPALLQRFVAGTPVSVSVIVQSKEQVYFLEPGRQVFDSEPFGKHVRTDFPLTPGLRQRALQLAKGVVDACPSCLGYFGIDMVLADCSEGDVVIEINPRLTTSYVFLREWSGENLAAKFPL